MRLKLPHLPYVARKIALDLSNSDFVTINSTIEEIEQFAFNILEEDLKLEFSIEEKVNELMDENEDDMEFMRVDRKALFWMIKKQISKDNDFILNFDDRYTNISHKLLDMLYEEDSISYTVTDNRITSVIFASISTYIKSFDEIEDIVSSKIDGYKKPLVPGSDEYDIVFQKLYEEELSKRGMF